MKEPTLFLNQRIEKLCNNKEQMKNALLSLLLSLTLLQLDACINLVRSMKIKNLKVSITSKWKSHFKTGYDINNVFLAAIAQFNSYTVLHIIPIFVSLLG